MVGVKVWVLEHFSILYQPCGYWCFIAHCPTQDDEKIIRMCYEVDHYVSLYELFQFDFVCCRWPKSCMTRIVILSSDTEVFVVFLPSFGSKWTLWTLTQRESWQQDTIHPSSCISCESWKTNVWSSPCNTCIDRLWQYQQIWHESCWH